MLWRTRIELYRIAGRIHDFDNGLLQLVLLLESKKYNGSCDGAFRAAVDHDSEEYFYRCWYEAMGYNGACPKDDSNCKMVITSNSRPSRFISPTVEIIPPFSGFKRRTETNDTKPNDFLLHTKRHDLFLHDRDVHCTT